VETTPPAMWLQPVGTATRDVTGESNRYLLSSIVSTSFRNCIKGAGIGCIDWPAATHDRRHSVANRSFLAREWLLCGYQLEVANGSIVPNPVDGEE